MYVNGSLNSSSVGRYVGASVSPCGLIRLGVSLTDDEDLFSTDDMSKPCALLALNGAAGAAGGIGVKLPFITEFDPFIPPSTAPFELALPPPPPLILDGGACWLCALGDTLLDVGLVVLVVDDVKPDSTAETTIIGGILL